MVKWAIGASQDKTLSPGVLTVLQGTQRPISDGNQGRSSLEPPLPLQDGSIFLGWPASAQLPWLMPGQASCWLAI